jgi:hypothetical protein
MIIANVKTVRAQKAVELERTYHGGLVTGECAVCHTILGILG